MPEKKRRGRAVRRDLPGYSLADVLLLTTASKSNMQHWTSTGLITADAVEATGRGHHRRFSAFNVIEVELAAAVNRFGVPTEVIRGGLNAFRGFHVGAVAFEDDRIDAPLNRRWFTSHGQRSGLAKKFGIEQAFKSGTKYVQELALSWLDIRGGPLVKGESDPHAAGRFLGLFISFDNEGRPVYAVVALNPDLTEIIEAGAIVIDLQNVVFQVGLHCRKLGISLGDL